ncbi:FAD-dependent monooxygenase [Rhodobium gokarnense]|uniref:Salicylate hydroxylase n=1 Tax=Rhodobium gokarnense TaxID=364296 RepID=A0ABT3HDF7_9HYPH|nr:FAD-dependent monooxygenase [Rhodobium gokarnense]MCW2308441.1 salicylate hydroxylase [Rhodobium gokarnense]
MSEKSAIVVGAGIGGLTAALCIARAGLSVTLLERASIVREVGAGLQISPNASRVLLDLGLGNPLHSDAVAVERLRICSARTGGELNRIEFGTRAMPRYGSPYWVVHRADLQDALHQAAQRDPRIEIHLGATLKGVDQDDTGASATVAVGDHEETYRGDLLIGADGVWSSVRRLGLGLPGAAFTGRTAWRAIVPASDIPADFLRDSVVWFGDGVHLVHYPIHAGNEFNLVAIVNDDWNEEGWNAEGDREVLLSRFSGWPDRVLNLLSLPETWLKWALCGMPTGSPWYSGRIALLGDSAHAMLPFMAQGAAMAIEDGAVLGDLLSRSDDIADVLKRYQGLRRKRVERVIATALKNDRIYHLRGFSAAARDTALQLIPSERLLSRFDWIYSWQPPHPAPA